MVPKESLVVGGQFRIVDVWDEYYYDKRDIDALNKMEKYTKCLGQMVTIKEIDWVDSKLIAHVHVHENDLTWFPFDLEFPDEPHEIDDGSIMPIFAFLGFE